ncbi:site-specific DNA-methyltransferase [Fibrobacter sp. UWH1]|uniref:site-specific DNA-methyltransferase n=1 Tax=Fibrobacter sp. UWH1 TaxID=1964354 RepID=UPI000B522631|nr:site-specific DNA-methyltransferase [Fibrobacter sp. UWH1]OWV04993.1 site-specific DNA-methyltransferase [Fibrobacter sp. UWH1]
MAEQKDMFEFKNEPIKGFPELRWAGKRPFTGTPYYPAQLKETHGETSEDGWMNKLYWGDNLQVMSHLLKEYRGKVNLIYIDPPFDSKADYKKTIALRGKKAESDSSNFEEKQYGDIWTNDEYLQFMYERLILCKELLSDSGYMMLHCDWHQNHYLRCLLEEVFSPNNFRNEIIWTYPGRERISEKKFSSKHDNLLFFSKQESSCFDPVTKEWSKEERIKALRRKIYTDEDGREWFWETRGQAMGIEPYKRYLDEYVEKGGALNDVWDDIQFLRGNHPERTDYPTQKPELLLERIINSLTTPGDIVFDCFMGSGTTQAVAMKLGRKFLGADINLGAIQTTTKRLINRAKEIQSDSNLLSTKTYTGFEVYNVNDYDFFRNELEAKRLIIDAMGMQALPENNLWEAELDGRMVAILGINRIATAAEFSKIINNIDMASWTKRQSENFNKPIEKITFVCMGHDPNLKAMFLEEMQKMGFKVDLEIVDILRDKKDLTFKRDADAKIKITKDKLTVKEFYPMNLLQKLSIESQDVEDWKELVDSIMIDWNYDGVTFSPSTTDIPEKNEMVKGEYSIPEDAGTIHVKITDLLSESWEGSFEVENG